MEHCAHFLPFASPSSIDSSGIVKTSEWAPCMVLQQSSSIRKSSFRASCTTVFFRLFVKYRWSQTVLLYLPFNERSGESLYSVKVILSHTDVFVSTVLLVSPVKNSYVMRGLR